MATFDYTTSLPQTRQRITSQQHRTLYGDIKTHINTFNAGGYTLPSNLANGDLLYFNGTTLVKLAAGTAGQYLQANGAAAPTWVSLSIPAGYTKKTTNFNPADGGRYACDTSGGAFNCTINFASTSVDDEFIIAPTDNASFETNAVTVVRNASEQIGGAAASFVCNINAEYHFRGNTTGNWDVDIRPLLR